MFGFFEKKKIEEVGMPMAGRVVPAAEIPDAAFAEEMMGPTLGIVPSDGRVYAPFDGKVESVFEMKHAVTLTSAGGMELIIHVGLDTVTLNGGPFMAHVASGQSVKKGELLLTADLKAIEAAGLKTVTPVVICNAGEYKAVTKNIEAAAVGEVLFTAEKG